MLRATEISEGWRVCAQSWLEPPGYLGFGKLDWIPAQVPGHVHRDLMAAGVIGDPFYALQELGCQWVDDVTWVYETEFQYQRDGAAPHRVLRFEGLDTICIMHLNGAEIARHDNMFVALQVDVDAWLKDGLNRLRVTFLPASKEVHARRARYFDRMSLSAELVRFEPYAFLRKAPYMFGWDWGPRLISAGVWKPVRLLEYRGRIEGVDVTQIHEPSGQVRLRCRAKVAGSGALRHVLSRPGEPSIVCEDAAEITLEKPTLWWPHGSGKPELYTLTTYLLPAGSDAQASLDELRAQALDVHQLRVGLRQIELLRIPDVWGESFQFAVNALELFCVGANWIPDHSFPSSVSREQLTAQLDRAIAMNINMLRVWGGGVYESDDFYDLCDERGILVWQDFPFACSYSPDDPEALTVIEAEARFNIERLRHHASLALWCGNNENQMMFEAKWDHPNRHPTCCLGSKIWQQLLPNLIASLDPGRAYLPTSPHSPPHAHELANADGCGDQHNWDVWHGRGDWVHYRASEARFASEYGFASAPTFAAWDHMLGAEWESLPVDHPVARWHDKTKKGYDTFRALVELHYPIARTLGQWTYFSQLNQRDALRAAVEHYRRSAFCAGSLIWQLNDCWPVQSWSVVDSTGGFKAAAHELPRLYAPVIASVERLEGEIPGKFTRARVWISMHNRRVAQVVEVVVTAREMASGQALLEARATVTMHPGQVEAVIDIDVSAFDPTQVVLWVSYEHTNAHVLLCEPKELEAPQPTFVARRRGAELWLSSDRPAVDVMIRPLGGGELTPGLLQYPEPGLRVLALEGECTELEVWHSIKLAPVRLPVELS